MFCSIFCVLNVARTLEDLTNQVEFTTLPLSFVSLNIKRLHLYRFLSKWWKTESLILYYFHYKSNLNTSTKMFLNNLKWNCLTNNLSLYTKAIPWKILPPKAKETFTFIAAKIAYKIVKIWKFNCVVFSIHKTTNKDVPYHFRTKIS